MRRCFYFCYSQHFEPFLSSVPQRWCICLWEILQGYRKYWSPLNIWNERTESCHALSGIKVEYFTQLSQTLHYWKLIGETWFYWLAKCLCTSAEGQEYHLLARQRQERVRISRQLSSLILNFKLWLVFRGWEKSWEKAHYFFRFPDSEEFVERAVEALDDQKDWHGQETLLFFSRLGLDAAMGWMRGLAMDTGEVHSHVCALLGCIKFYLKKPLKWIQINRSQRCLFCSTGWDRL